MDTNFGQSFKKEMGKRGIISFIGVYHVFSAAIRDLGLVKELKNQSQKPFAFSQIAVGKSPCCSLTQLRKAGVSLLMNSTPCLFAAQTAVDGVSSLRESNGLLNSSEKGAVDLQGCTVLLNEYLVSRDTDE